MRDTSPLAQKILILLCMPENKKEWVEQGVEALLLKKCAYWLWLGRHLEVEDTESTTAVYIPKDNVFTPEVLHIIMEKVSRGETLNGL